MLSCLRAPARTGRYTDMPKTPDKPKSRKPLSLYPLSMDEALRIAMTAGSPKPKPKAKRKG